MLENKVTSKYIVLDNGSPAQYPFHKVDIYWDNAHFNSYAQAIGYATLWLGTYLASKIKKWPVNTRLYYNGVDYIEIRALDYLDGIYLENKRIDL